MFTQLESDAVPRVSVAWLGAARGNMRPNARGLSQRRVRDSLERAGESGESARALALARPGRRRDGDRSQDRAAPRMRTGCGSTRCAPGRGASGRREFRMSVGRVGRDGVTTGRCVAGVARPRTIRIARRGRRCPPDGWRSDVSVASRVMHMARHMGRPSSNPQPRETDAQPRFQRARGRGHIPYSKFYITWERLRPGARGGGGDSPPGARGAGARRYSRLVNTRV